MTTSSICRKLLQAAAPPVFWLGVWQLAAQTIGQGFLLPTPLSVLSALARLAGTDSFWQSVLLSLARVLCGLGGGIFLGSLLALATHFFPWGRALLAPLVRTVRAIPVVSFILLILLWAPRDHVAAIAAGLMVIPVMWENIVRGLAQTDDKLLELARCYRFSRLKTGRLVYFPSALPYFLSGAVTSMGLAWKSGVAAEVICQPPFAIGTGMQLSRLYLETPDLFAWTAVVVALSLSLERLLARLLTGSNRRWAG